MPESRQLTLAFFISLVIVTTCEKLLNPLENLLEGTLLAVKKDTSAVDARRNPNAAQSCGV